MAQQRIDRLLAGQSMNSRKEITAMIRAGRVQVNGRVVRAPDTKADPETDELMLDGKRIGYQAHRYLMMNKPAGVISATDDPRQKTVLDLVPEELRRKEMFPAGRLDKDTTGLLILTDDGDFAHRMLSPRREIFKLYFAELDAPVGEIEAAQFAEGITLSDGTRCRPARLTPAQDACAAFVSVCEGRFHQVKRMFEAVGRTVTALERMRIGGLELDRTLAPGECRELSEAERERVFMPEGNEYKK